MEAGALAGGIPMRGSGASLIDGRQKYIYGGNTGATANRWWRRPRERGLETGSTGGGAVYDGVGGASHHHALHQRRLAEGTIHISRGKPELREAARAADGVTLCYSRACTTTRTMMQMYIQYFNNM